VSPLRRTANTIVASLLLDVASFAALIVVWLPAFFAYFGVGATILVPIVALAFVLVWLTAPLMIGVATGFAQVALDAGRVVSSVRFGLANAFAKPSRGRALGVALPLVVIFAIGNMGGYYAGAAVLGLTDNIVAYVILLTAGEVAALSLLTAVAAVYYRNPLRAA